MGLFGGEKITLTLEKYDYIPGDTIKGKIKLNLKKPVQARKLSVAFIGKKISHQSSASVAGIAVGASGGRNRSKHSSQIIYNFDMPIDGEKEYQKEEYPFEIKIPTDLSQNNPQMEGKLGGVLKAAQMLGGVSTRIDWYVKAELDVPMKLDIKKSQKIVLSTE
jgi:hypothetical protein